MYAKCPYCSQRVVLKTDGTCPHCKNHIALYAESVQSAPDGSRKIPVRVACALFLYAVVITLILVLVLQFELDELSFFLLAVTLLGVVGIVSLLFRLSWSRSYNIALQVIVILCSLTISTAMIMSGALSGIGFIAVLLGFGLQAWVTIGFVSDKVVIAYLKKERIP